MIHAIVIAAALCIGVPPLAPNGLLDDAAIKVDSPDAIARTRAALIEAIWKQQGFPKSKLPDPVESNIAPPFPELADLAKAADRLTVDMELGLRSVVYYLHPAERKHKLAIFHQGHDNELLRNGGLATVRFFLERGYDVLAIAMPLMGTNKHDAPVPKKTHDELIGTAADDLPYHPIKFFLEPVIVALNHAMKADNQEHMVMIGISGGGWTTTLIAALDTRIQCSFPVAGSWPLHMRGAPDKGDLEQYTPDIYAIAGYPDLYVMGASGRGRAQVQILNHEDPCCFKAKTVPAYAAQVAAAVSKIGPGKFACQIDASHNEHTISAHALSDFVAPFLP